MSEYINIISCEELMRPSIWPTLIVGAIAIIGLLSTLYYFWKSKNYDKTVKLVAIFGAGGIFLMLAVLAISNFFSKVPSGRYKYEATINKDKITVSEYEEFIEEYRPTIKDNIYYFEGGPLDE